MSQATVSIALAASVGHVREVMNDQLWYAHFISPYFGIQMTNLGHPLVPTLFVCISMTTRIDPKIVINKIKWKEANETLFKLNDLNLLNFVLPSVCMKLYDTY